MKEEPHRMLMEDSDTLWSFLTEQLREFIKKECLYAKHFASFVEFRAAIEDSLSELGIIHKPKLATVMTHNFQTFNNRSILAA